MIVSRFFAFCHVVFHISVSIKLFHVSAHNTCILKCCYSVVCCINMSFSIFVIIVCLCSWIVDQLRRIVRERISKLKEDLKQIDIQMATQRSNRGQLVRLALVGYTNVGKSTFIKRFMDLMVIPNIDNEYKK